MKHYKEFKSIEVKKCRAFLQDAPGRGEPPYVAIEGLSGFYRGGGFPCSWLPSARAAAKELWEAHEERMSRTARTVAGFEVSCIHGTARLNGRALSREEVDRLVVALLRASTEAEA